MDHAARRASWRLLFVPLVAATLLFAWLAFARADRSAAPRKVGAAPTTKLTASDLLLAAAKAKAGISLEYDGVTGPPSSDHTNHAPLNSFQFGVGRGIGSVTSGRPVSAANVSEITVTHRADKYSAPLLQESLTGTGKNAIVYFTNFAAKGTPVDYLEVDLENVLISGFSMSSGGDVPQESLSFNFTKFTMKYKLGGGAPGSVQTVTFDLANPGGG